MESYLLIYLITIVALISMIAIICWLIDRIRGCFKSSWNSFPLKKKIIFFILLLMTAIACISAILVMDDAIYTNIIVNVGLIFVLSIITVLLVTLDKYAQNISKE